MMGIGEPLWWALMGLVCGGLVSMLASERTPGGVGAVVGVGIVSAVLGGWSWALFRGSGPPSLLGAAILGVLGALAVLALLRGSDHPRYRA